MCGGPDSNRRIPAETDLESVAFDQALQPPQRRGIENVHIIVFHGLKLTSGQSIDMLCNTIEPNYRVLGKFCTVRCGSCLRAGGGYGSRHGQSH